MARIAVALPSKPLAVFCVNRAGGLDVVFADTVKSSQQIKVREGFVGLFHKEMEKNGVRQRLKEALL